jgi:hypothetical protein
MLFNAAIHTITAQSVAFFQPQRQKHLWGAAVSATRFGKQRERSHPIDIVISENDDAFPSIEGSQNSCHSRFHIRQQKWIA